MGKSQSSNSKEIEPSRQLPQQSSSSSLNKKQQADILNKLIFLGDDKVGKTAIMQRINNKDFTEDYLPTIGVDFSMLNLTIPNILWRDLHKNIFQGAKTRTQLWDTAGQPRFRSLIPSYLRGCDGIIFVYDASRPETLRNIQQQWLPLALQEERQRQKKIQLLILGNKTDLNISVDLEEVQQIADKYGMISSTVSAKTGENIETTTMKLIRTIVQSKVDMVPQKDIYMNLLLHINEDFDDDLLQDTIEILVDM